MSSSVRLHLPQRLVADAGRGPVPARTGPVRATAAATGRTCAAAKTAGASPGWRCGWRGGIRRCSSTSGPTSYVSRNRSRAAACAHAQQVEPRRKERRPAIGRASSIQRLPTSLLNDLQSRRAVRPDPGGCGRETGSGSGSTRSSFIRCLSVDARRAAGGSTGVEGDPPVPLSADSEAAAFFPRPRPPRVPRRRFFGASPAASSSPAGSAFSATGDRGFRGRLL